MGFNEDGNCLTESTRETDASSSVDVIQEVISGARENKSIPVPRPDPNQTLSRRAKFHGFMAKLFGLGGWTRPQ
jgi:hypothetical protein